MVTQKAKDIVAEIRNQPILDITGMGQHADEEKQITEIQKLLDRNVDVKIVDKPVFEHNNEKIHLSSFKIQDGLEIPDDAKTVFIWTWNKWVPPISNREIDQTKTTFGTILLKEEVEIIRMQWR